MATGGSITSLWAMLTEIGLLEVPDFQRNYAWEANNCADLYSDIKSSQESKRSHFLGSTILMVQKNDNADGRNHVYVVDGQQRLTSLFMLVSIMRDRVSSLTIKRIPPAGRGVPVDVESKCHEFLFSNEENAEQRFQANTMISVMFSESIVSFPDKDRPQLPKKHHNYSLNLRKAYWKFESLLDADLEKKADEESKLRFLWDLLKTIKEDLQILKIVTDTYEESLDVFVTLNSRGMELGPSDLIKSELFRNLSRIVGRDQIELFSTDFAAEWALLIESLQESDIDMFLRHYLVSVHNWKLQSKLMPTRVKEHLVEEANKIAAGTAEQKLEQASRKFFNQIKLAADLYGKINTVAKIQNEREAQLYRVRLPLLVLENVLKSHRIMFLALYSPATANFSDSEKYKIARIAEVLGVRWVFCGENAQDLENIFQKAALEIRSATGTSAKVIEILKASMPSDQKCQIFFQEPITDATLVRTVLYRMNQLAYDRSQLVPYSSSKIQVEHVAPATPNTHWLGVIAPNNSGDDQKKEYESTVELWGNKTILDEHINNEVKQHSFKDKCDGFDEGGKNKMAGYKNSQLDTTKHLVGIPAWDSGTIAHRNTWLAQLFVKVWKDETDSLNFEGFKEWLQSR
jgi:hypothetical protein